MAAPRKFRTAGADAGQALATWLAARLGEPVAAAAARVAAGAVHVDGRRARDPGQLLPAAVTVAVHGSELPAEGEGAAEAAPGGWRVVLNRGGALVIDKPAGLASQAERGRGGALDEQVAARYGGATLVHRIDRETSGLVLFARNDVARRTLAAYLEGGQLERAYLAVVAGVPSAPAFVLDAPIGPDAKDRRRQAARVSGGKPARTEVDVERAAPATRRALLRCRLETGRTHQLRVHLADAGLPILGDPIYAPPAVAAAAPRLALHATRLAWPGGVAASPLPDDLAALV